MNKLIATFALIFTTISLIQAQNGYVKFNSESEFREKTVKVFRGEVIPYFNSAKANRINIVVGKDTITDLGLTSNKYEIVSNPVTKYASQQQEFLQIKKGDVVWVNAVSIPATDTVTLFSDKGVQVTQLITKREADVKLSDLGNICRLIISNSPTIFYETNKLTHFVEPAPQEGIKTEETTDESKETGSGLAWWIWVLIGLAVVASGFLIWRKFFGSASRSNSEDYVSFNGGSLKDFAKQYGGLDLLSSINPSGIIPDKKSYDRLTKSEKNLLINELTNQKIKVKSSNKSDFGFGSLDDSRKENQEANIRNWETPKETFTPQTSFGNNNELSGQLRQMESKILLEIQRMSMGNSSANQLNEIRKEKQDLETKLMELLNDKRKVEEKLAKVELDFNDQYNKLQQSQDEVSMVQQEMKGLKEKVIVLDFLKPYSESVFTYLKYCQQVSNDAFNLFNRISHHNPEQAFAAGQLLMKYQSAINNIPVGNWLQIAEDIKDTGATTNRQLNRSFSQLQNDTEKEKQFKMQLFSQVLTKYSGNLLILTEAFKNLSRFQGANEFTNEAYNSFGKHVTEILNKAKSTGLELKHVSLFESGEKHLGKVEEKGDEKSLAYRQISGLEKGTIAEIVSIGVKTTFEDTPTIIILA